MKRILSLCLLGLFPGSSAFAGTTILQQSASDCISQHVNATPSEQKVIEQLCSADNLWAQSNSMDLLNYRAQYLTTPLFTPIHPIGADSPFMDRLAGGIALEYEEIDVWTDQGNGNQAVLDHTIAGYLSYLINDNFSFDFTAGRTGTDIYQNQLLSLSSFPPPSLETNRSFYTGNLSGSWILNRWVLGAHIGYLAAHENQDAFTVLGVNNRDSDLQQWRSGLDVAYAFQSSLEPYIGLDYLRDINRELVLDTPPGSHLPGNDNEAYLFSAGLRYFRHEKFSSNLQFNISADRQEIDFSSLILLLRLDL